MGLGHHKGNIMNNGYKLTNDIIIEFNKAIDVKIQNIPDDSILSKRVNIAKINSYEDSKKILNQVINKLLEEENVS